jgi:hypothetical protein
VPEPDLETEAVAAQDQQRKRPGNAAALRPYQIKKGEVRNPTGRPKVPAEVREAAMALTPDAIRTLGEIMLDQSAPPATRVTAADKILDRALGRPAQQLDVTERREVLNYSLQDLLRIAYGQEAGRSEARHGTAGQGEVRPGEAMLGKTTQGEDIIEAEPASVEPPSAAPPPREPTHKPAHNERDMLDELVDDDDDDKD